MADIDVFTLEIKNNWLLLCVNGEPIPNQTNLRLVQTTGDIPTLTADFFIDDKKIRLGSRRC